MKAAKKQVPRESLTFVLRGHRAPLREKRSEFLSNTQKTAHGQHHNSHVLVSNRASSNNLEDTSWNQEEEMARLSSREDDPRIDDLEESLQKLKVQEGSLASRWNSASDTEDATSSDATDLWSPGQSQWPEGQSTPSPLGEKEALPKAPIDWEWFLSPQSLASPLGNYSRLRTLGLPSRSLSPGDYTASLLERGILTRSCLPSVALVMDGSPAQSNPPKLGAPHVIGVKSLLPPKIPVRFCSPQRRGASPGVPRGRSLSLTRSHSFSPASKRMRWVRSRSQSPRPMWRPNSTNGKACAQPPPQFIPPGGRRKKTSLTRPARSRIYKPWPWAARQGCLPLKTKEEDVLDHSWSPYCLPVPGISSPLAQEMNERFFQTLEEGNVPLSLGTVAPIQKAQTRFRLQCLRAEEEWVLELKRQQELERTRGPKSKWYEMKSSQFHYEAHKQNESLKNSQDSRSLRNSRRALASEAKDLDKRRRPTGQNDE
ncbi:uncharacterized protein LOC103095850 [Monodelphis domestica]|uniref:uncharacterized protein LOC103095850 n=1 Tax=Monodelphis domestica TaxID=13616 RepID=UPI0004432584|nr:uncharacterized protein LOC103095850 [Monodelphis domestica]